MKLFYLISIVLLSIGQICFSDIKSTQGSIDFDINSNGHHEATLNDTGLGIGTSPAAQLHVQGNSLIEKSLSIGTTSGSSNLNLSGSMSLSLQRISSNTQLGEHSIVLVDSSSDNIILSLPDVASSEGKIFHIKKISIASQLWINASDNIEGHDASYELTTSDNHSMPFIKLISDGNNWYALAESEGIFKVISADNLVAWLKFDDLSGDVATESSIYSHSTSLRNGLTFSDNGVTGLFNRALDFEGNNDLSARITGHSVLSSSNELTISAWIYPTSTSNGQIVRKNNEYLFRLNGTGTLLARIYTGGGWSASTMSTGTYTLSQWNHLVMRWDGSKIEYFINGQLDSTSIAVTGPIIDTGNSLDVGGWGSTFPMAGIMDEFRTYNRALSDSEILALAEQSP